MVPAHRQRAVSRMHSGPLLKSSSYDEQEWIWRSAGPRASQVLNSCRWCWGWWGDLLAPGQGAQAWNLSREDERFDRKADLTVRHRTRSMDPGGWLRAHHNRISLRVSTAAPIRWHHIYLPILPRDLVDYLSAPMPFLVGLTSEMLPLIRHIPMSEVTMVDLDLQKVSPPPGSQSDDGRALPYGRQLGAALEAVFKTVRSPTEYESSPLITGARTAGIGLGRLLGVRVWAGMGEELCGGSLNQAGLTERTEARHRRCRESGSGGLRDVDGRCARCCNQSARGCSSMAAVAASRTASNERQAKPATSTSKCNGHMKD
jgi:hypothetical protein